MLQRRCNGVRSSSRVPATSMSDSEPMRDPSLPGQAPLANDDVEQFSLFGTASDAPVEPPPSEAALAAADLDAQAQALWEADPRAVKPAWSQLGDTTKGLRVAGHAPGGLRAPGRGRHRAPRLER